MGIELAKYIRLATVNVKVQAVIIMIIIVMTDDDNLDDTNLKQM